MEPDIYDRIEPTDPPTPAQMRSRCGVAILFLSFLLAATGHFISGWLLWLWFLTVSGGLTFLGGIILLGGISDRLDEYARDLPPGK